MLDLETLSTEPNAMILSIGVAAFDERGVMTPLHVVLDLAEQDKLGRHIDPETVMFWMKQSSEARAVFEFGKTPLTEALVNLANYIDVHTVGVDKVKAWSNGADFDLVLLKTLYKQMRMTPPWRFFNHRCFRTLKELHREDYATATAKFQRVTHHNAADDARWQALVASHILKRRSTQAAVIDSVGALCGAEDDFPGVADGQEKNDLAKAWWDYDRA
jgi:hypothetical protein